MGSRDMQNAPGKDTKADATGADRNLWKIEVTAQSLSPSLLIVRL
jgi:hypothetical protein